MLLYVLLFILSVITLFIVESIFQHLTAKQLGYCKTCGTTLAEQKILRDIKKADRY